MTKFSIFLVGSSPPLIFTWSPVYTDPWWERQLELWVESTSVLSLNVFGATKSATNNEKKKKKRTNETKVT